MSYYIIDKKPIRIIPGSSGKIKINKIEVVAKEGSRFRLSSDVKDLSDPNNRVATVIHFRFLSESFIPLKVALMDGKFYNVRKHMTSEVEMLTYDVVNQIMMAINRFWK